MKRFVQTKKTCAAVLLMFAVMGATSARATEDLAKTCETVLKALPGPGGKDKVQQVCSKVQILDGCTSYEKRPIFHVDFISERVAPKNILVFALVHGDEFESGSVARRWMERLSDLKSRNSWRIVPILNPDGYHAKTRTNSRKVDINRNFPSKNWEEAALKYWSNQVKRDPRKFPGDKPGSEVETLCAMSHIETFKPDFVIAVHTPYGVLDFDGPTMQKPRFSYLPWASLGTYPGSLGRYMWADKQVPVLTIELRMNNMDFLKNVDSMDILQDLSGSVAVTAGANIKPKKFDN